MNIIFGKDVFLEPVSIKSSSGSIYKIKVDTIISAYGLYIIGGWATGKIDFEFESNDKTFVPIEIYRFPRNDVNEALNISMSNPVGFGFCVKCDNPGELKLIPKIENEKFCLSINKDHISTEFSPDHISIIGEEIFNTVRGLGSEGQKWIEEAQSGATGINCGIECAFRFPCNEFGNPILISGWLIAPDGVEMQTCKIDGKYGGELEIQFYPRADIVGNDLFINKTRRGNGFIAIVREFDIRERKISLKLSRMNASFIAATTHVETLFSYRAFLERIFGIPICSSELEYIYIKLFMPLLTGIQKLRNENIIEASKEQERIGDSCANVKMSVIIPVYGTLACLKEQIEFFKQDTHFAPMSELIYVIDDLSIFDEFKLFINKESENVRFQIKWIRCAASMGFSGSCNLGASIASGKYLLFLNSDAYPLQNGAFKYFIELFEKYPSFGVLGCKLINPDGSLQHKGLDIYKDKELKIYICKTSEMNKEKSNIGSQDMILCDAICGACMCITKKLFDQLKGFNINYLIGGYEDIDLCIKATCQNKKIKCVDNIVVVHANHLSFMKISDKEFFKRLQVYNALIFKEYIKGLEKNRNNEELMFLN